MANDNERHVVPNPNGGWDVVKPDAQRASSHHDTQAEAISRGRASSATPAAGNSTFTDATALSEQRTPSLPAMTRATFRADRNPADRQQGTRVQQRCRVPCCLAVAPVSRERA